jgi:hypothetical protein
MHKVNSHERHSVGRAAPGNPFRSSCVQLTHDIRHNVQRDRIAVVAVDESREGGFYPCLDTATPIVDPETNAVRQLGLAARLLREHLTGDEVEVAALSLPRKFAECSLVHRSSEGQGVDTKVGVEGKILSPRCLSVVGRILIYPSQ